MEASKRVRSVNESPTLVITAKAQKKKADGLDVIALAAGEPDFDTPQHIKDAGIQAIREGFTRYTPVPGTLGLRKAIAAKFARDNQVDYEPGQVLVSCGGKHSLYNLCMAYLNPGDEVIIPAPYWVSYPDMVLLAEAIPVLVSCGIEQQYKLTPNQLEQAITPKTRMFILNSPSNPTGAVYGFEELQALAEVLMRYPQILIMSDDMYEHIMLGETSFCNILNVCPELKERTVLFNGVSKAYAMTGWRIGYAAGPSPLIQAMIKVQSQSTSNPCSISQFAAEVALNGDQSCRKPLLEAFNERHDFIVNRVNGIHGLKCIRAGGAFYTFIDCRDAIERLQDRGQIAERTDLALADYLLEKELVAVVPGSAFGAEGYFRISFATSMDNLQKAFDRIEKALS